MNSTSGMSVGLAVAIVFVSVEAGFAATTPLAPSAPSKVKVVTATLHPAAEPRPALKHRLLPPLLDRRPGNSVPQYITAGLMLMDDDHDKMMKEVHKWRETDPSKWDMKKVRQLAQHTALVRLGTAARRERCHWDVPLRSSRGDGRDEGFSLRMPEFSLFRGLTRLLVLRIRLEVHEGKFDEAVYDLQTGFALARDLGQHPTIIGQLVGVAVGRRMTLEVERLVQRPDAPNLYWALSELPRPFCDARNAELDGSIIFALFPELKDLDAFTYTPEQWGRLVLKRMAQFAKVTASPEPKRDELKELKAQLDAYVAPRYDDAKRYLASHGRTAEQIKAMAPGQAVLIHAMHQFLDIRDDLLKWLTVPYWQAQGPLTRLETKAAEMARRNMAGPFLISLVAFRSYYASLTRMDRDIAALRCIEAVRLYAAAHDGKLPATLAAITAVPVPIDPMTGKPFPYKLAGKTAVLELPKQEEQHGPGKRYELTVAQQSDGERQP